MNEIAEKSITTDCLKNQTVEKTVTTRELAETLGVDVSTVTKTVKALNETSDVLPKFKQGQTPRFNEKQVTIIKQEIQKHHNLQTRQIDCVATELEENQMIANAIMILQRRNSELKHRAEIAENEVKRLTPAANFAYQLCSSKDAIDIGNCAKVLNRNIGRNRLFALLREKQIFKPDNIPYQKFIDAGYFRVVETKYSLPSGEIKISLKTLVFQKGIAYINRLLREEA